MRDDFPKGLLTLINVNYIQFSKQHTVEIGVFCTPKCTGKEAKTPTHKKPRV